MKTVEKPDPSGSGCFSFITLGCKSNQYDSAAMASDLLQVGLRNADPADADIVFINTCMVTGPAEARCRKAIRHVRRTNPRARLVVGGCMSRGAKDQLASLSQADLILDPQDKGRLAELLGISRQSSGSCAWSDWPADPAVIPYLRDRAFLKIQDGCDASCSYCIVPAVRGSSRSLEATKVLNAVRRLMGSGSLEVVLSGIHLGQYGRDLDDSMTLEVLLMRLIEEGLPGRVRLSSIEPLEITDSLISVIRRGAGFICRHIHIPVQSGSDRILAGMDRPYTSRDLEESIIRLLREVPGIGLGCDVICGFPGETKHDFALTEKIITDFRIPFVHAFPYSPRPGTKASLLKDDVPHGEKKARVKSLRSLADRNRAHFAGKQVGSSLTVAIESGQRGRNRVKGLADNYLKVEVEEGTGLQPGDLVDVFIAGSRGDTLEGRPGMTGGEGKNRPK